MNKYIGNTMQLYGVKEYRLTGGRGDGMRMLAVKNGKGLEFEISLDRCGDISVLTFKGDNYGYFAPCGYVSPQYYDDNGAGFLKSFTAGFFTTCGLTAVGSPCTDDGEVLPLHGTIGNTPCENYGWWIKGDEIHIKLTVRDAALFSHKYILEREYICRTDRNEITLKDTVTNIGFGKTPFEMMYHCNMGYPLLSENAVLTIPSKDVSPRDDHAAEDIDNCLKMEKPQHGYVEECFYYKMTGDTSVSIINPDIGKGLTMKYNADVLDCFTEWKMMGEGEYVLGLEPGNCTPDGRDVMRENGTLKFLDAGESAEHKIVFEFTEVI